MSPPMSWALRRTPSGLPLHRVPADDAAQARAKEREWQRGHLPAAIRELVLDDQQRRSAICWHAFDD